MAGKIVILSAPSGAGKSSVIKHLMQHRPDLNLEFSISATSRKPRPGETHGKEYYFLSPEEFRKKIADSEFIEWEEVYPDNFYGTLEKEIERILAKGGTAIMDVDVKGGINIKKKFGDRAVSIFLMPPSAEELERRLRGRASDSEESIAARLAKAEYELTFAKEFDHTVVNRELADAADEVAELIKNG